MRICNRNYTDGSMYTKKTIRGIACCPNCEKPIACHNESVDSRAMFWSMMDDRGISSIAIARHMTGMHMVSAISNSPPSDADDRGRCIRLLELIPEWITRLPEMVQYDERLSEEIVINSSGMSASTNTWAKQIPLIIKEGKL